MIHLEQHICSSKRPCAERFLEDLVGLSAGENQVAKTVPHLPRVIQGVYKGDLNPQLHDKYESDLAELHVQHLQPLIETSLRSSFGPFVFLENKNSQKT